METQFDITRRFEEDKESFSKENQRRIAESINKYAPIFDIELGDKTNHIYQPCKVQLPDGLDSSLYVLKVNPQIRVLLTIEDDPLFDRKLVTLIRVVKHNDLDLAFKGVSESFYQNLYAMENANG